MERFLPVHREWHGAQAGTAPQFLICTYCVLARGEHTDLAVPCWRWY